MPLFAHQYHDSSFPVWKRGSSAQIYVSKILKPGEYEGTALSAPKGGRHPSVIHKQARDATFFSDSQDSSEMEPDDFSQGRARKYITFCFTLRTVTKDDTHIHLYIMSSNYVKKKKDSSV